MESLECVHFKVGRRTYGEGGDFIRDQNTLATATAKAGSDKIASDLTLNSMRTNENTGNYANALAESQRQSKRDLTDQLATADANRLQQLTAWHIEPVSFNLNHRFTVEYSDTLLD